jgi:hypothetical protein
MDFAIGLLIMICFSVCCYPLWVVCEWVWAKIRGKA